jgi:MinD-like ATPase involved in chromosome partitioning or flagellar assembly
MATLRLGLDDKYFGLGHYLADIIIMAEAQEIRRHVASSSVRFLITDTTSPKISSSLAMRMSSVTQLSAGRQLPGEHCESATH